MGVDKGEGLIMGSRERGEGLREGKAGGEGLRVGKAGGNG